MVHCFRIYGLILLTHFLVITGCNNPDSQHNSRKKDFSELERHQDAEMDSLLVQLSNGKSIDLHVKANKLLHDVRKTNDSLRISQVNEIIAQSFYFQQEIDKAIHHWKIGYKMIPSRNHDLQATFASNLGSAYMFKGYSQTAISYFLEARRIFKKSPKKNNNYWINFLNLGICYMESGDFKTAELYFNKIPYKNNKMLDVIVPLNIAKLFGLQENYSMFKRHISIALRNENHAPYYIPILKEVHLEFNEKIGNVQELKYTFNKYKNQFGKLNTTFDLLLWRTSIKIGKPLGNLVKLQNTQAVINNSDYYLLLSYYRTLSDWYVYKDDFKKAFLSEGLIKYCEKKLEQKVARDKLLDFTVLSKRNELQHTLFEERKLNRLKYKSLQNQSYFLYFLITIFLLLILISVLLFNNQHRKNKLIKKQLTIQELELKIAKEEQNKLEYTIGFKDKKLASILETVGKIAILKKQLDDFFIYIDKVPDLGKDTKSTIKKAKFDFHLFFNNYQDLAVLSNLIETDSTNVNPIKQKYSILNENELRVLLLIMENFTSKEMAMLLSCTEKNIEYYRTQIRKKLIIPKDILIHEFIDLTI